MSNEQDITITFRQTGLIRAIKLVGGIFLLGLGLVFIAAYCGTAGHDEVIKRFTLIPTALLFLIFAGAMFRAAFGSRPVAYWDGATLRVETLLMRRSVRGQDITGIHALTTKGMIQYFILTEGRKLGAPLPRLKSAEGKSLYDFVDELVSHRSSLDTPRGMTPVKQVFPL